MRTAERRAAVLKDRLLAFESFATLPGECLDGLLAVSRLRAFENGGEILTEGLPSPSLFVVLGGRAKMVRHGRFGRDVLLALFGKGEIVGAVAALNRLPSDTTVETIERTDCLEVSASGLIRMLRHHPEWLGDVLALLSAQLVECKNCLVEVIAGRVEERFAHLFLRLGDAIGKQSDDGLVLSARLSRQDLANMTGTTTESAIRLMSRWGKVGWVETTRDGFVIQDRVALERIIET